MNVLSIVAFETEADFCSEDMPQKSTNLAFGLVGHRLYSMQIHELPLFLG